MMSVSTGLGILFKVGGFAIAGAILSNILEAMEKDKLKIALDLIILVSLMYFGVNFAMEAIRYVLRLGWII